MHVSLLSLLFVPISHIQCAGNEEWHLFSNTGLFSHMWQPYSECTQLRGPPRIGDVSNILELSQVLGLSQNCSETIPNSARGSLGTSRSLEILQNPE